MRHLALLIGMHMQSALAGTGWIQIAPGECAPKEHTQMFSIGLKVKVILL